MKNLIVLDSLILNYEQNGGVRQGIFSVEENFEWVSENW